MRPLPNALHPNGLAVLQCPNVSGQVGEDVCAAALAASSFAREHQYTIVPGIDEALGDHSIIVQDFRDLASILLSAFVSVVRLDQVGKLTREVPFDLRIDQRPEWLRRHA